MVFLVPWMLTLIVEKLQGSEKSYVMFIKLNGEKNGDYQTWLQVAKVCIGRTDCLLIRSHIFRLALTICSFFVSLVLQNMGSRCPRLSQGSLAVAHVGQPALRHRRAAFSLRVSITPWHDSRAVSTDYRYKSLYPRFWTTRDRNETFIVVVQKRQSNLNISSEQFAVSEWEVFFLRGNDLHFWQT